MMMTMTMPDPVISAALDLRRPVSEESLIGAGAALARSWYHIEESKTEVLRDLAVIVVRLRMLHRKADGSVDWSGNSWDYRKAVARMYEGAGIPPDSVDNIQASIRYHVGNVIREMAKPADLEAAGLLSASPRERLQVARDQAAAMLEALSVPDNLPAGRGRTVRTLRAATMALASVAADLSAAPADLDDLRPAVLEVVAALRPVMDRAGLTLEDAFAAEPPPPPARRGRGRPHRT